MLQTFLAIAVPAMATVATALYLLRSMAMEEQEMRRPPPFRPRPGLSIDSGAAASRRPATRPSPRTQSTTPRGPAGDSTVAYRRTGSSTASNPNTETCVVCYEVGNLVELYPCRHKNLCKDCVSRIITWNRRNCPLCRRHIQGFSDSI